jgi:hypothetical protein
MSGSFLWRQLSIDNYHVKESQFLLLSRQKCIKMPSLFTLLRFFDELFDVITFWRCKKLLLWSILKNGAWLLCYVTKMCTKRSIPTIFAKISVQWTECTSWDTIFNAKSWTHFNTQYMTNSTLVYPVKMEYRSNLWLKVSFIVCTYIHHKTLY